MKKKVIVYERLETPVLERLKQKYDVKFFKGIDPKTDEAFLNFLKDVEGVIGLRFPTDEWLLKQAPHLKIVSNVSVGYENLNLEAMTRRKIMGTNTPHVLTDTVADAIFGLLIATARRIPELDHLVKSRQWKASLTEAHYGYDVHHKTLGIIGMGEIGQAIAKRAHFGFDMKILYHNRRRHETAEKQLQATYKSLEDLLKESDFVLLMTPLTEETRGLLGYEQFKLMKRSAIFINGSRGHTIIEEDLIRALNEGEITAAGLDVFQQEPINEDNPLLDMPNVVTLPHIGSSTYETELKMSELAAENLIAGLNGQKPPTLLNEEVWKKINE